MPSSASSWIRPAWFGSRAIPRPAISRAATARIRRNRAEARISSWRRSIRKPTPAVRCFTSPTSAAAASICRMPWRWTAAGSIYLAGSTTSTNFPLGGNPSRKHARRRHRCIPAEVRPRGHRAGPIALFHLPRRRRHRCRQRNRRGCSRKNLCGRDHALERFPAHFVGLCAASCTARRMRSS